MDTKIEETYSERQNGLPDQPDNIDYTQKVANFKSKRLKMITKTAPMNSKDTVGALAFKICFNSIEDDDFSSSVRSNPYMGFVVEKNRDRDIYEELFSFEEKK